MLTPAEKARITQMAMLDTARHGAPGDLDKLIAYLKENPNAVEELAEQQGHVSDVKWSGVDDSAGSPAAK